MSVPLPRKLGGIRFRVAQVIQSASYRLPLPCSRRLISKFWESQAQSIDEHWGHAEHDYEVLAGLLDTYLPRSILDVGCGSGRLFKLFSQRGILDVVGMDISSEALTLAQQRYPFAVTIKARVEELKFPINRFDLAVCNRVLQHIPPHAIAESVSKLCKMCKMVYVNELSGSDELSEEFYMFRHDLRSLFTSNGLVILETGSLGKQTYHLYGHPGSAIAPRESLDHVNQLRPR